jgi:hypothetical protein
MPFINRIQNIGTNLVSEDPASACWVLQMTRQTKIYRDPSGTGLLFCDNFSTRHILAALLKAITDREAQIVGTAYFINVDTMN